MLARIDRHWSMDVPKGWMTALRAFSPITTAHSWLAIRWFPMRRLLNGKPVDCGRWVLHDCQPVALIDRRLNDIVSLLEAERPSSIRDWRARKARMLHVSDYQWEMYRTHRVWAKEYWVLQGSAGGHPTQYRPHEEKWLQAMGLPTDPPALGALPYAPLDARVFEQLRLRNRLWRLGSVDALRKSETPQAIQAEFDAAEREFRKQHYTMMHDAMAASADFLAYYATSSKTATEARETIPETSPEHARKAAIAHEQYVETGILPH